MAKKEMIPVPGVVPKNPFSPVIRFGDTLYIAGQVGEDENGNVPPTIQEQTALAIENSKKLIEAAGATLADVLMVSVYLKNGEDFAGMNEAYRKYFGGEHNMAPARFAVTAPPVADKYLIEIVMIAGLQD